MLTSQKYFNKKVAIYGMGITGYSAAKTLKKLGAKTFCWDDSKKARKKIKNLKFHLNKFWLKKNSIDNIVISPGIDINKCKIKNYLKKNLEKIITDLDLFFELNKNAAIISVTGTNGKSTTCKIIEKILKTAKYNVSTVGNIGNPILSLDKIKKNIIILEVSSYQLQYSKLFRSKYAAILNISPDHLERHQNIRNYINVKSRIFFSQNTSDFSYINADNKHSKLIKKIFKSKKLRSKLISINKLKYNFILKKIHNNYFKSKGNIENLVFACAIAKKLKISNKIIISAANKFKGLPHRQEIVFSNKKLLCINDSKATSFDACFQSLSNYNQIYWIVGGIPKYQDIFYLNKFKKKIIKAYVVGKNISFFVKQIKGKITFTVSKNMKNAVNSISKDIKLNNSVRKTILLSPAAASFDQFSNFENRGNYFKKLIIKKFK
tara:strand:- start:167 stop:1471 length:1305 start_codon:yes stop_codon:yes gene_type:complete